MRRATSSVNTADKEARFLSTLSLRRATARRESRQQPAGISIHALLAESDGTKKFKMPVPAYFYPRSPCGERLRLFFIILDLFDFYPRSPCGERLCVLWMVLNRPLFLSTLSLRRATLVQIIISGYARISIHALLAESDLAPKQNATQQTNFYPRSPCGERHDGLIASANFCKFLSTLSLRRATIECRWQNQRQNQFLSTLSLRRATIRATILEEVIPYFYPRSPCGERPGSRHIS